MPARGNAADERVVGSERQTQASRAGAALADAMRGLEPQDQMILRLRFQDGFTVARIAELIGEEQKPLYRRFDRLFARLRESLSAFGVTDEDVSDLFGHPSVELAPVFAPAAVGKDVPGPSTRLTPGGRHA
jgi:RNA polymerase sigma factor for flagellar operon FliA